MPWRIVTRDLLAERPHMHHADLRAPGYHMRTYFDDQSVEILLGGGPNVYRSNVQAIVQKDDTVTVRAHWFNPFYVMVLDNILASVDLPREARGARNPPTTRTTVASAAPRGGSATFRHRPSSSPTSAGRSS